MRQCLECAVHPQGKLGGCTVISCGVTLNYTTYYLNLRNTGANPSRKKKINPRTVSTISKTKKSCRARLAFAKCPFLANTAKQVLFQNGTRPEVIILQSGQHWSTGLFLTYCNMAIQSEPPPLGGVTLYEVNTWVEPGERVYSFYNQVWQFHPFELSSQTPP